MYGTKINRNNNSVYYGHWSHTIIVNCQIQTVIGFRNGN